MTPRARSAKTITTNAKASAAKIANRGLAPAISPVMAATEVTASGQSHRTQSSLAAIRRLPQGRSAPTKRRPSPPSSSTSGASM